MVGRCVAQHRVAMEPSSPTHSASSSSSQPGRDSPSADSPDSSRYVSSGDEDVEEVSDYKVRDDYRLISDRPLSRAFSSCSGDPLALSIVPTWPSSLLVGSSEGAAASSAGRSGAGEEPAMNEFVENTDWLESSSVEELTRHYELIVLPLLRSCLFSRPLVPDLEVMVAKYRACVPWVFETPTFAEEKDNGGDVEFVDTAAGLVGDDGQGGGDISAQEAQQIRLRQRFLLHLSLLAYESLQRVLRACGASFASRFRRLQEYRRLPSLHGSSAGVRTSEMEELSMYLCGVVNESPRRRLEWFTCTDTLLRTASVTRVLLHAARLGSLKSRQTIMLQRSHDSEGGGLLRHLAVDSLVAGKVMLLVLILVLLYQGLNVSYEVPRTTYTSW
eukprot:GHVS01100361.1.p1 GENE.GHVS01100361.1~~GHVS01100361.1.p1  ORF type:complete len:387 (+),score=68.69 GHVS01100361.1:125-1285(+)